MKETLKKWMSNPLVSWGGTILLVIAVLSFISQSVAETLFWTAFVALAAVIILAELFLYLR
jgi:peptidoglycan/LPS O-acetylase OafA/YrhL